MLKSSMLPCLVRLRSKKDDSYADVFVTAVEKFCIRGGQVYDGQVDEVESEWPLEHFEVDAVIQTSY